MQFPVISSDATHNSSINTNVSSDENNITFVNTGNPAQGIDFIEAIITGDIEFIGSLPAVDLIRLDAGVTMVIKNVPVEEATIKKELVTKKSSILSILTVHVFQFSFLEMMILMLEQDVGEYLVAKCCKHLKELRCIKAILLNNRAQPSF